MYRCVVRWSSDGVTINREASAAGIRREDKNKWERRVPLTPDHVRSLIAQLGVKVLVQPSNLRIFPDAAYVDAGADLTDDLSAADVILAVKEVPISLLLPRRTYLFFSHTIKAQAQNMPLLDALLEKRIRLVDYECITVGGQRGGKRLVAFGRYAGIAGMVDFLRGLGERYLSLGYSTPFLGGKGPAPVFLRARRRAGIFPPSSPPLGCCCSGRHVHVSQRPARPGCGAVLRRRDPRARAACRALPLHRCRHR